MTLQQQHAEQSQSYTVSLSDMRLQGHSNDPGALLRIIENHCVGRQSQHSNSTVDKHETCSEGLTLQGS